MKARTRIILTHILAGCLAAQLGFMLSFQPICDDETFHHSWQAAWKGSNKPRQPQIDWILSGAAKVATEDVIDSLQMGFPLHGFTNKGKLGDNHKSSLLLYNPSTLAKPLAGWQKNHTRLNLPTLYWTLATARCAEMKHLLLTADSRGRHTKTCLAIVAQRESYYINKWIRDGSLEKPFQFASRFDFPSDHTCFSKNVPSKEQIDASSEVLVPYLTHLDAALQRLKPLADQVANAGQNPSTKGTIIVMVCNFGHAELFINYICAARAVGMDTSQILLFATDEETYDIARGLGIAAFHDEKIFESIPKTASAIYGDRQYGKIMMSKVYCVHLVVELGTYSNLLSRMCTLHPDDTPAFATGHSVLFQDVDIIPYRSDYLVYFVTKLAPPEYDLTFQMDHNLRQEYQPWIANSGCYYVRNNAKTRHFFASFVVRGDAMILAVRSHQVRLLFFSMRLLYWLFTPRYFRLRCTRY